MPIRIPQETVFVVRDGKTVKPEIGKPFNFTTDELDDLKRLRPQAIRVPVNETADADDGDNGSASTPAASKPAANKAGGKAGNNDKL